MIGERSYGLAASDESAGERGQFVAFRIGDQRYCVDIMSVREIRVTSTITPLPGAPEFVRGVINLRGTIVPVCDLRSRFGQGMTELSRGHAIVIVSIAGRLTGLLVDEVCDIVEAAAAEMAPVPETDSSRRNPFFNGLITKVDGMLIMVSLDCLMDGAARPQAMLAEKVA
jgi:purine-binding chemotaxis protein CheW